MTLALTDKQAGSKWRNYLTCQEITVQTDMLHSRRHWREFLLREHVLGLLESTWLRKIKVTYANIANLAPVTVSSEICKRDFGNQGY